MEKRTLNLSVDLGQQSGFEVKCKSSKFPQGEQYIKIEDYQDAYKIRINSRCNNSDDLMKIIMTVGAIRHNCGDTRIELFIPYLPYSRQDRVCRQGEAFSLRVIADILNNLKVDEVITYDVHSNVAEILFDKLTIIDNISEVREFIKDAGFAEGRGGKALISPDAGASKKSEALFQNNQHVFDTLIYCNKERRPDGGIGIKEIKNYIKDMDVLVVDDICDGGATFIELGRRLEEANVRSASLFVSHGIFSKGVDRLYNYYNHIGTTDSIHTARQSLLAKTYKLNY